MKRTVEDVSMDIKAIATLTGVFIRSLTEMEPNDDAMGCVGNFLEYRLHELSEELSEVSE